MSECILAKREVAQRLKLSIRAVERLLDLRPVQLTQKRIGYRERDVDKWVATRPKKKAV